MAIKFKKNLIEMKTHGRFKSLLIRTAEGAVKPPSTSEPIDCTPLINYVNDNDVILDVDNITYRINDGPIVSRTLPVDSWEWPLNEEHEQQWQLFMKEVLTVLIGYYEGGYHHPSFTMLFNDAGVDSPQAMALSETRNFSEGQFPSGFYIGGVTQDGVVSVDDQEIPLTNQIWIDGANVEMNAGPSLPPNLEPVAFDVVPTNYKIEILPTPDASPDHDLYHLWRKAQIDLETPMRAADDDSQDGPLVGYSCGKLIVTHGPFELCRFARSSCTVDLEHNSRIAEIDEIDYQGFVVSVNDIEYSDALYFDEYNECRIHIELPSGLILKGTIDSWDITLELSPAVKQNENNNINVVVKSPLTSKFVRRNGDSFGDNFEISEDERTLTACLKPIYYPCSKVKSGCLDIVFEQLEEVHTNFEARVVINGEDYGTHVLHDTRDLKTRKYLTFGEHKWIVEYYRDWHELYIIGVKNPQHDHQSIELHVVSGPDKIQVKGVYDTDYDNPGHSDNGDAHENPTARYYRDSNKVTVCLNNNNCFGTTDTTDFNTTVEGRDLSTNDDVSTPFHYDIVVNGEHLNPNFENFAKNDLDFIYSYSNEGEVVTIRGPMGYGHYNDALHMQLIPPPHNKGPLLIPDEDPNKNPTVNFDEATGIITFCSYAYRPQ